MADQGDREALMSLPEVARYLAMTERTIYDWAQTGKIPAFKLGATWRFRRSEIDAWLQSQHSGPQVPVTRREGPVVPPVETEPTRWQRIAACKAEIEATISDTTRTTFLVSQFDDEFGPNIVSDAVEELRRDGRIALSTVKARDGERVRVIRRRS